MRVCHAGDPPVAGPGALRRACGATSAPRRRFAAPHPGVAFPAATSRPSRFKRPPSSPGAWLAGAAGTEDACPAHGALLLCGGPSRRGFRQWPGLSAQPALPVPLPVGAIGPACPLGGTARASCRYALVPEPKIAGDARLPWRGSGDVTRRQSPAAPRSGAEEWERASPSIPPGAGGGRVVPGKMGGAPSLMGRETWGRAPRLQFWGPPFGSPPRSPSLGFPSPFLKAVLRMQLCC